jgi:hypothetical protein
MAQHPPLAVHWIPAQRIAPAEQVRTLADEHLFWEAVNVRFFEVDENIKMMDTRGLDPFGIPDVEARFAGVEPGRVAAELTKLAQYLWSRGRDVFDDGDTFDGLDGEEWSAVHARSSAGPDRPVLRVTAGRYAVSGD